MITKNCHYFFLLLLPLVTSLSLQSQQITGNVVDENGNPISGASLTIEAIAFETVADFDGNFELPENATLPITLIVSAVGFATQVVQIYEDTIDNLSVVLQVGQNLDEVIITSGRKAEKIQDAPNSVSVIQTREIANKPVFNPLMYLENLAGIDIQRQSGNRVNVNLRGPSGVLTSDTYVMLDYRGIVQTGLNVFDQGSTTLNSLDLERVELVRGPVSSLYGPGIASGVIHFLSRDPFKHPGTEIELSGGNLGTLRTQVRHAGTNRKKSFGYKINAGYQQIGEWDLPSQLKNVLGQPAEFKQPLSQKNTSLRTDLSLYFQVNNNLQITTVAGYTNLTTNLWTDRGPAYQDANDFFIQARAKTDNLFVQFVYNSNVNNPDNKGFLYFTGEEAVIDRTQSEIQIQYNNEFRPINTQYTLGAERRSGQFKAPVTFGRFDVNDDLIIAGAYFQTKTAISPEFDVVLSGRLDHYEYNNEFSFSPNAAIVFKPSSNHTLRASFSQTYITPSAIELHTDFPYVQTPDLDIWLYGSRDKISVPENPDVQFFTPLLPNQRGYDISHATLASIFHQQFELPVPDFGGASGWNVIDKAIRDFAGNLGLNSALVANLPLFSDHMKSDELLSQLRNLEPITRGIGINRDGDPLQPRSNDRARLRKEVNFELGWKGIIANRVQLSVDVFNLTGSDFSQIRTITPLVAYPNAINDIKNSIKDGKLNSALEAHTLSYVQNVYRSIGVPLSGLPPGVLGPNPIPSASQVTNLLWSGPDGQGGIKEIYSGAVEALSALIPASGVLGVTISNNNPTHPKPIMIDSYTNSGIDKITYTGIDVGTKVLIDPNNSAYANWSYISQNVWKGKADLGPQAQESDFFGLHKPRHRLRAGYNYNPVKGFNFGVATQFQSKFESLLAPLFNGIVESRLLVNANVGYNAKKIAVYVNVDNLFGTKYQLFPGMPIVGTRALVTARIKF